jgi:hypothetical protein
MIDLSIVRLLRVLVAVCPFDVGVCGDYDPELGNCI